MGVWLGPMRSNKVSFITENDYEYTNASIAPVYASDEQGVNWEIVLKGSGTLKFKKNPGVIDVFAVGGGQSGYNGTPNGKAKNRGGSGGNGGECVTSIISNILKGKLYPIVIGGSDADTKGFGVTAATAGGAEGGQGGYVLCNSTILLDRDQPSYGNPGNYAFGEINASMSYPTRQFGAGGGGAQARSCLNKTNPGNDDYFPTITGSIAGGTSGGGSGGVYNGNGSDAGFGTGSGGGGGGSDCGTEHSGGAGASGIIIIRNHRSS